MLEMASSIMKELKNFIRRTANIQKAKKIFSVIEGR
jgi:hypothetical protein